MKFRYVLAALCGMLLAVSAVTIDDYQRNDLRDFDDGFMDISSDALEDMLLDQQAAGRRLNLARGILKKFEGVDGDMLDESAFDELEDTSSDPQFFRGGFGGGFRPGFGAGFRGDFGIGRGGFGGGFGIGRGGFGVGFRGGFGRGRFFDVEENDDVSQDSAEELTSDDLGETMFDPQGFGGRRGGFWGGRGGGWGGWGGRGGGWGGWGGRGGGWGGWGGRGGGWGGWGGRGGGWGGWGGRGGGWGGRF